MQFHKEMEVMRTKLQARGFTVLVPADLDHIENNESYMTNDEDKISTKIEFDFIREHFKKIEQADAILILNYEKKGIAGYIGGNTFLEMGYAFGLDKKVYLLNSIPEMDYKTEMYAIQPIILDGDTDKILS